MSPAVQRISGPAYIRDGIMFTPRAVIAQCEVCGHEHAPHGFTDNTGKRTYFCSAHLPKEGKAE